MWKTLATVVVLASSSLALRADNPTPEIGMDRDQLWELKHSDRARAELARREAFFEAEMAAGAVPVWAGTYYDGDGLGRNIDVRVSPQAGFIYTWSGCLGLYDLDYGSVEERHGRLLMTFELPNDKGLFGGPEELQHVRWGERNYLLADEDFKRFVNAVNSGSEPEQPCVPRCGAFLLREGDEMKAVSGRPDLPAEYRKLLLDGPISGRIAQVVGVETKLESLGDFGRRTTTVEIDVGRAEGVWVGMELYSNLDTWPGSGFEVRSVGDHHAIAVVTETIYLGEPALEPGLCVSTRPSEQTCPDE